MKAAVLYHPGKAENLIIEERPVPDPGDQQLLVRVKAFGLNRSELMTRKGLSPTVTFPRILGIECVGEVERDPSGDLKKGQKILAYMGGMGRIFDGSYAEYAVLPRSILHPVQSSLPWEILGAIPELYQTVYGSLHLALNIQEGESLLIRGGTSSVGMLSARIARNKGVTVIATTRNALKEKILRDNGASHVLIDDGTLREKVRSIFPGGAHKVLELVGALTLKDSLECLQRGGIACMTGMLSETWSIADFEPMEFIPATVQLTTYNSGGVRSPTPVFQEFIHTVESGQVDLKPARVFKLDDIVQAHQCMENNQANGKIVVTT